nr:GNAT family N-acetyltransferase [Frigoribacterium sp. VKM Ac-1396]
MPDRVAGAWPPTTSSPGDPVTDLVIDELVVPTTLEPGGHADRVADYVEAVALENAVQAEVLGFGDLDFGPAEQLPQWHDPFSPRRLFVVRSGGRIVGQATYETLAEPAVTTCWLGVAVAREHRRRGVGTALLDHVEAVARAAGRTDAISFVASTQGVAAARGVAPADRLEASTGHGWVPRASSEVRFALARGYALGQVERISRLALPVDGEALAAIRSEALAAAGDEYRVHTWSGPTPRPWRSDVAAMATALSTDAPTGDVPEPEDVWTVERLVEAERRRASTGRASLTAAAEHVPSGRLVACSDLAVPDDASRPVMQQMTLVRRDHRGHRLGWLVKVANLDQLAVERPGRSAVLTFNAEENRPMLAVNEAVGFVPVGVEGVWHRLL